MNMSSESVTDSDDSDDVTGCSASMDYDSPGSDLVNDPDDDPVSSNTAPVLLIMALTEWALQHHIPRIAFCSLLGILKPYHSQLPLDPRTLLKTPIRYAFKDMSGGQGQYYQFGISMGIQLHKCPQRPSPLLLQFNVDRLPLFKSLSTELWPILWYVKQSQLEPFVVGLYCGKKLASGPLCTDADFYAKTSEEHHSVPTPLSSMNFGLITGFALDYRYMHFDSFRHCDSNVKFLAQRSHPQGLALQVDYQLVQ